MIIPILGYVNWSLLNFHPVNPFGPMLFVSHLIPSSLPKDPRYAKGGLDLIFVAYHIVVFSFLRQFVTLKVIRPVAVQLGIRTERKLDRFGEQTYAMLYWGSMGVWGMVSAFLPSCFSTSYLIKMSSISCQLCQLGGIQLRTFGIVCVSFISQTSKSHRTLQRHRLSTLGHGAPTETLLLDAVVFLDTAAPCSWS